MSAPEEGLRLVFLDIDGVICCNRVGELEASKLAQLQRICRETGAKVVLSTDWRRQAALKRQVIQALARLDMECVGATPQRATMFQPVRPQEITEWLRCTSHSVSTWVAIDDRDLVHELGGAALHGHFVKTNPNTGLTARLADRCISILAPLAVGSRPSPSRHGRVAGGFAAPLRRHDEESASVPPAPRGVRAGAPSLWRGGADDARPLSAPGARAGAGAIDDRLRVGIDGAPPQSPGGSYAPPLRPEVACRAPTLQLPSEYSGIGGSAASAQQATPPRRSPGYAAPRGAARSRPAPDAAALSSALAATRITPPGGGSPPSPVSQTYEPQYRRPPTAPLGRPASYGAAPRVARHPGSPSRYSSGGYPHQR